MQSERVRTKIRDVRIAEDGQRVIGVGEPSTSQTALVTRGARLRIGAVAGAVVPARRDAVQNSSGASGS